MNDDMSEFARVDTTELDWAPSPSPSVWRKRCYLDGDHEKGAVTSVVRYDPESTFPTHSHPEGEELFVLSGVFEDDSGAYPAGMFVLNPPGSSHAPRSEPGCLLFVRLRQYDGDEVVRIDTGEASGWETHPDLKGVETLPLWGDGTVAYRMVRLHPGTELPSVELPALEEIFVVSGSFVDEKGEHGRHTWLRFPAGSSHKPRTVDGCTLLVRKRAPT